MSIDVNWESATSGPDGEALAERIRSFVHDKFQQVALPRFIRSVQVHSFDFGTIPPDLQIKDFCEPFTDFYEEDEDDEISEVSEELMSEHGSVSNTNDDNPWSAAHSEFSEPSYPNEFAMNSQALRDPFDGQGYSSGLRSPMNNHLNSHFLPRTGTPGLPVGTSTLGYHLMSLGALSGTQTPLAAVAGGSPFANGWSDSGIGPASRMRLEKPSALAYPYAAAQQQQLQQQQRRMEGDLDTSSVSRPSTANASSPSNQDANNNNHKNNDGTDDPSTIASASDLLHRQNESHMGDTPSSAAAAAAAAAPGHHQHHHHHHHNHPIPSTPFQPPPRMRERKPEDFQVLCHAKYAGDIRLSLTAEILLDYPMPSFVGLPLKLNVTGITFDGVAVIAYIRKRVHFCFLSADDADAVIGSEERQQQQQQQQQQQDSTNNNDNNNNNNNSNNANTGRPAGERQGGLLQQIRVESEIGRKEDGKQVLKNVGKVERFVLAQVRRIFEEELVFPSFWTFLV